MQLNTDDREEMQYYLNGWLKINNLDVKMQVILGLGEYDAMLGEQEIDVWVRHNGKQYLFTATVDIDEYLQYADKSQYCFHFAENLMQEFRKPEFRKEFQI